MRDFIREPLTYVVLYLIVGIVTFGDAWNYVPEKEVGYFGGQEYTIHNGPGTRMLAAVGGGLAWPLYWSVRLQK